MTTHVTAIYENGLLRPTEPLPLNDGDRIDFTVDVPAGPGVPHDVLLATALLMFPSLSRRCRRPTEGSFFNVTFRDISGHPATSAA